MLEVLIYPVLLSVLQYLSEKLHRVLNNHPRLETNLFSFASGVLITFLILHLLPELMIGTEYLSYFLYVFVLIGFTGYLLIHEILYKYVPDRKKLYFELREAYAAVALSFHFIIGLILVELVRYSGLKAGLLIFIPIAIHVSFSSLASHHLSYAKNYKRTTADRIMQFLVIIAPIQGALAGLFLSWSNLVIFALYGVVGGVMLFMVIREFIPNPKEAQPIYFALGQLFFISLLIAQHFFVWS